MKSVTYTINCPDGVHARPAGELVKAAKGFACDIELEGRGKKISLKSGIFALMGLGLRKGDTVVISCSGDDEEAASAALLEVMNSLI